MPKEQNPDVAIILVNWNGWKDTVDCVRSCQKLINTLYHVVIVDNNSQDNSEQILREHFAQEANITILQSGENLGFAGGNNFGIRYISAQFEIKYFWLLNNDTVIEPSTLSELVAVAEKNPQAGIIGSKIYYYNSSKLWFAGGKFLKRTGYTQHLGMLEEDDDTYSQEQHVDFISGCSLFITKGAIDKIGLMKEDYFLYFEDTDWNFAAHNHNLQVIYCPRSRVWHKVSQSVGQHSAIYYYYVFRNSLFFIKRYNLLLLPYIFLFRCAEICSLFFKGERSASFAAAKGVWHFLKNKLGKL